MRWWAAKRRPDEGEEAHPAAAPLSRADGNGRGRDVATVAGALAGGYAGNQVQKNMQHNDTYTTSSKRCRNVSKTEEKAAGYDVRYRFDGKESVVRTDYIPINRIPVKDGKLVLANSEQGTGNVQKSVVGKQQ